MTRKRVDDRISALLRHADSTKHRAMLVMVGDRGKDQVANIHTAVSRLRLTRPNVLWCYKDNLGFTSHRNKRLNRIKLRRRAGIYIEGDDAENLFWQFQEGTDVRYSKYNASHKLMGQTFDMCVLQDFEALTPNIMCRTMETVRGGGIIIILLKTVSSLNQLYNLTMDVHRKFVSRDEDANSMFQVIKPRFCERLILSLTQCSSCMITDDELNVLPLTHNQAGKLEIPEKTDTTADDQLESLRSGFASSKVLSALLGICITLDQADCLGEIGSYFASGVLKSGCIAVTSGRGRGKSAALGLTVALALVYGLRNIFITSPAPDNVGTLFEFLSRGLLALGYSENVDFIRVMGAAEEYREAEESLVINSQDRASSRTSGPREYVVGIDLPKTNQKVKYLSPRDVKLLTMADTLLIDEAAAIPLHTLRSLIDNTYLSIMATTVDGYEGTGKALSIQLLDHLKKKDGFKLIQLDQAIRYAANDPIEAWLQGLLCLKTCQMEPVGCPQKQSSKFVKVNRDALFCYHPISEIMLANIQSLFTWSNYRNSPDDLFTMSDAPNVDLFALVVADQDCLSPKILAAIEVAYEAGIVYQAARKHNRSEAIDSYVSWTIANYFTEPEFASLTGVRITKIGAVTPELREKAVASLLDFFRQQSTDDSATTTASEDSLSEADTPLTSARVSLKSEVPALLKVGELPILDFDWCSSTFDLDESALKFWTSRDFTPVWIGQKVNDITRLHPCITLHQLRDPSGENRQWADLFKINFARRFLCWLSGPFKVMKTRVVLSILQHAIKLRELLSKSEYDPRILLTQDYVSRLKYHVEEKDDSSLRIVQELLYYPALLYFRGQLGRVKGSPTTLQIVLGSCLQGKSDSQMASELSLKSPVEVHKGRLKFTKQLFECLQNYQPS